MEIDLQPAKKPRRWLRGTLAAVFFLVVWPGCLALYNWWTSHRNLNETLAFLKEEGMPLSFEEMLPETLDPDVEYFADHGLIRVLAGEEEVYEGKSRETWEAEIRDWANWAAFRPKAIDEFDWNGISQNSGGHTVWRDQSMRQA